MFMARVLISAVLLLAAAACAAATAEASRVPVEFFVMSKCSDAALCEAQFLPVLVELRDHVNVSMYHLGWKHMVEKPDYRGFDCRHGDLECKGNLQQQCAQIIDKRNNPYSLTWMKFAACATGDKRFVPVNGDDCAAQVGLDWSSIDACTTNGVGAAAFRSTITEAFNRGVAHSCTVFVNNQWFCLHDDDWKEAKCAGDINGQPRAPVALKQEICNALPAGSRPSVC